MKYAVLLFSLLFVVSCKNKTEESTTTLEETPMEEVAVEASQEMEVESQEMNDYAPQSNDDAMAANIKNFLKNDYLKNDLTNLEEIDRKFQFYKIDLNNDGKEEIMVNFLSPYFCGSGGCTLLLLSHEAEVITKFSVTRTPIWVENEMVNGWKTLLVKDRGELKALTFQNGSYPSNPSVLPKAPFDAASGSAEIMFDENFSKPKTYTY